MRLKESGQVKKRFNWLFLSAGDSREPELAGIRAIRFDGKSIYHAVTFKVVRRLLDDLSFNVAYTLSESRDDASSPGPTAFESNVPQNVRDIFPGEEASGVGWLVGGLGGYSWVLEDVFVVSLGLGLQYADISAEVRGDRIGSRRFGPTGRASIGFAF